MFRLELPDLSSTLGKINRPTKYSPRPGQPAPHRKALRRHGCPGADPNKKGTAMHRRILSIALWAITLQLSVFGSGAHAQPAGDDPVQRLRDAKYAAVSPDEVSQARVRANDALARLDALLARAGRPG